MTFVTETLDRPLETRWIAGSCAKSFYGDLVMTAIK